MQAGDYLIIGGEFLRIKRASDRFVHLESGVRLTREYAGQFKCSSEHDGSEARNHCGQDEKANQPRQLGLF